MNENFKVRVESEAFFPEFFNTELSMSSVAEIFEMQKGSQRQKWPGVVEGLGELTKEKLLKPFDMENEGWRFDQEETESLAQQFLGKELDELGVLAERIIDEAMERLSQESGKDSFPVKKWVECLIADSDTNPIGNEYPDKYYPAVQRAAEVLTVAAFDDMNDLEGVIKFLYAAGSIEIEDCVNEIIRDLSYEAFERAKEFQNPITLVTAEISRRKLQRNILSPAIRNHIAKSRMTIINELRKNLFTDLKPSEDMDPQTKEKDDE